MSRNHDFDRAIHSKVPDILFFTFEILQILFVLLNNTWDLTGYEFNLNNIKDFN